MMLNGTPKILIADDHPIFRSGVKQILSQGMKTISIAEAPDVRETMRLVRSNEWDVVVLDIATLGKNALQVLKDAKESASPIANSHVQHGFFRSPCPESNRQWS